MPDKYLFVGDHAETLASGRPVGPGDTVPAAALDLDDPTDQRLLEEEILIDTKEKR